MAADVGGRAVLAIGRTWVDAGRRAWGQSTPITRPLNLTHVWHYRKSIGLISGERAGSEGTASWVTAEYVSTTVARCVSDVVKQQFTSD